MEETLIQIAIAILLTRVKNPEKNARVRKAFLKVYRAIGAAFADDPEFQTPVVVRKAKRK